MITRTPSGLGAVAAAALLLTAPASARPLATEEFKLLLPQLAGPQNLGRNATAVLNLRIWRTLRARSRDADFGAGEIIWSQSPLTVPWPESAAQALTIRDADMILWGSAMQYGTGVVVQTSLRVRPPATIDVGGGIVWEVKLGNRSLRLGLPRSQFEFGPVGLDAEVVRQFSSPSALRTCREKKVETCTDDEIGPEMRADLHDGPWSHVRVNGKPAGWLYLGALGTTGDDIVSFTGGLISYFRGDLAQAEGLFTRTVENPAADPVLRGDAAALRVAAASRLGRGTTPMVEQLRDEEPHSTYVLQVAVMDALERFRRAPSTGNRHRIDELAKDLRGSSHLFQDKAWLEAAEAMFDALD
jgi:hypothetical protein